MSLLLDTHVLLWWLSGERTLTEEASRAIADPDERVLVSAVSIWEIAVKTSLGKLRIDGDIAGASHEAGFEELPVRWSHARAIGSLEPIHRDPFDRLLVAQALTDGHTIATRDPALEQYGVQILPA